MDPDKLADRIVDEFGAGRRDARAVAEKATDLKAETESSSSEWDGPEIDADYIISRLDMAPDHLPVTSKWDWWAGSIKFAELTQDNYKIG
jgi:hypothetical protein